MQIRVALGWEHECCGDAYELDTVVTKDLFLPVHGKIVDGEYLEMHHGQFTGGVSVTGRVVGLEVLSPQGTFARITRLPSATAINGIFTADSGAFVVAATGLILEFEPDEYIIILDVAEGTDLPTERARSAF